MTVSYDINGREFEDPKTHEVRYFNTIRGYKIERYGNVEEKAQQTPAPNASNNPQQTVATSAQEQGDENQLPF